MKPYQVYYFRDDFTKPIILYEFDTNKEAIECCNECDKRKTRQTCFESDGKYYVGEYITEDTFRFICVHFHIIEQYLYPQLAASESNIYFWTEQAAYGDWQYFFDNITRQFSRKFLSIGD